MSIAIPLFPEQTPPESVVDTLLADYLERVNAPLIGIVPIERRQRFVAEIASHLESLVEDYSSREADPEQAVRRALADHGAPAKLAEAFLLAWFQRGAKGPLEARFGRANCIAFGVFVVLQAVYLLFLQVRVFEPYGVFYRLPLSPGQIRQFWPAPLPFPEASPQFLLLVGYPLLAPFVAGIWIGRLVPVGAGRAVYQALLPLILCSFGVGACLLPVTEGIAFALVQLAVWLPAGVLTAHLSSRMERLRRMGGQP